MRAKIKAQVDVENERREVRKIVPGVIGSRDTCSEDRCANRRMLPPPARGEKIERER